MKPNIDLENILVKIAIDIHSNEVLRALDAPHDVEKAVIPIYAIPKRKGHQKKATKLEQIGSGVLVNIADQYFIFSATHVFREFDEKALVTSSGQGELVTQIVGERFSTGNLNSPDNNIYDATVFHVKSELPQKLKSIAITLESFDFDINEQIAPIYLSTGFRIKKSNTSGDRIKSKREAFPSVEFRIQDYQVAGLNYEAQIAIAYEKQVLVDDKWVLSPKLTGLSGGALIKVVGTNVLGKSNDKIPKQVLSAINIEQHQEKNKKMGYVLGTRTNVYLGLIVKFLPEMKRYLVDELTKRQKVS